MYKVLIADDEPRFRAFLRQVIDWNKHGFDLCAEAKNGEEALVMSLEHQPDIVLLDISMPLIDGIALTEKLKERFNEIYIVLITGHSEFEYARKALKLGVEDYIVKPYNKDELLSSLIKIRIKLEKDQDDRVKTKNDNFFMRERFLNMLISDDYKGKEEESSKVFHNLGIELISNVFTVASIEIDDLYQKWKEPADIALWKFAVSNLLHDIMEVDGVHYAFLGPEGRIVSIVNFKEAAGLKGVETAEAYRLLCQSVSKYLKFTVTVGIGGQAYCIREIRKSYVESVLALQNKLVEQSGIVIEYASLTDKSWTTGFYRVELNDKIQLALRINDRNEINDAIQEVFDYVRQTRISVDFAYTILMGLVSICLSYITEMGEPITKVLGNGFSPYSEMKSKSTLEAAFSWILDIYDHTIIYFDSHRATRSQKVTESVKEYIKQNYKDSELSVDQISRSVFLDPSYIRKLFTKEMKMNISDYITDVRIQKAKELLSNSDIRHADIAERVGYSDPAYFSKVFKKHYGIAPSEFQNAAKKTSE